MPSRPLLLLLLLLLLAGALVLPARAQEDLTILDDWLRYTDAPNTLYHHLMEEAFHLLDEREAAVSGLTTPAQWQARQQAVRRALAEAVGPFPARTPLRTRITGTVQQPGFRVEKVLYESVPGFAVTAAVFVPEGRPGSHPAIVFCSGHTEDGFRSATYQTMILNLVRKGFLVLAFDPVGQGERLQYLDPETGQSWIGGATKEHAYPGAQAFIAGTSIATYMIWDGIRAVDYLLTRPDVDPARIGITGRSGGGTQSALIAAFDERIHAAAPEAYITSFRRLLASDGPQDAEQNLARGLALGLDHADLLAVRAPKPTLVISTTRDFFSIQGARETVAEVQRLYTALGAPDALRHAVDDAGHASTPANREAMYRFFMEVFDVPGDPADEPVDVLTDADLRVTETGQVQSSLKGRTLHDLIRAEAQARWQMHRAAAGSERDRVDAAVRAARRLSGYRAPRGLPAPVFAGRYQRDGYTVERYFVESDGGYPLPYLLFEPAADGPHPAVLYVHDDGKTAEAEPGGAIEALVQDGYVVLAPDLPGLGELGPGDLRGDAYAFDVGQGAYNLWFAGLLVGRSLVGVQAGAVLRLVQVLHQHAGVDPVRITGVARGTMTATLLHAAAFGAGLARTVLVEPLLSYRSLVEAERYDPALVHGTVPGALPAYDLPDLVASLAPHPVLVLDPVAADGQPAADAAVQAWREAACRAHVRAGAANQCAVEQTSEDDGRTPVEAWLRPVD